MGIIVRMRCNALVGRRQALRGKQFSTDTMGAGVFRTALENSEHNHEFVYKNGHTRQADRHKEETNSPRRSFISGGVGSVFGVCLTPSGQGALSTNLPRTDCTISMRRENSAKRIANSDQSEALRFSFPFVRLKTVCNPDPQFLKRYGFKPLLCTQSSSISLNLFRCV